MGLVYAWKEVKMDDERSHWPIYSVVPMELIKIVSDTVRKAPLETVASKDGMVVYFPGKGGESSEKIRERRKK